MKELGSLTKDDVNQLISHDDNNNTISLSNEIKNYHKQLDNLTLTINGLLDGLDSISNQTDAAKDSQEKLYSAHHKVNIILSFLFYLFLFINFLFYRNVSLIQVIL